MLDLSVPTRGQIKFGLTVCHCGKEFTKRRHGQRFCSEECGNKARARRAGRVSNDPRHVAKRGRLRRLQSVNLPESPHVREGLEATEGATRYPYTGNPCKRLKLANKNNTLQEANSRSSLVKRTDFPVDLIGGRIRTSKQPFDARVLLNVIDAEAGPDRIT